MVAVMVWCGAAMEPASNKAIQLESVMTKAASIKGSELTIADADAATNDEADDETDDEDDYKDNGVNNGVQIVVATLLSRLLGVGVSESDRKCSSSGAAIVLVDLGATACQRFACRPGRAFAALALFDR
jgi:hypothetical protein